jgi:1-acyl-sn-glycerol-3-phosphate acyltransferase
VAQDGREVVDSNDWKWYQFFKAALFAPVVKLLFRARITGGERIPKKGGVLIASNHLGAMDAIVLAALVYRHLTFPAKAELFDGSRGLGSRIVAWFMRTIGQVALDRADPNQANAALRPIIARVKEGGAVGIYPEGTRSVDGRLYKGKTGVARIALATGAPVVPVAVFDTKEHRSWIGIPWLTRPRVVVGEPLDFSQYQGQENNHDALRKVTDEVMAAIQKLSGQEYVDVYGKEVKYHLISQEEADAKVLPYPGFAG